MSEAKFTPRPIERYHVLPQGGVSKHSQGDWYIAHEADALIAEMYEALKDALMTTYQMEQKMGADGNLGAMGGEV